MSDLCLYFVFYIYSTRTFSSFIYFFKKEKCHNFYYFCLPFCIHWKYSYCTQLLVVKLTSLKNSIYLHFVRKKQVHKMVEVENMLRHCFYHASMHKNCSSESEKYFLLIWKFGTKIFWLKKGPLTNRHHQLIIPSNFWNTVHRAE